MLGLSASVTDNTPALSRAVEQGVFKSIDHAAAKVRKDAVESIQSAPGPSQPGTPPHTHTAGFTKKGKRRRGVFPVAIAFSADKATKDAIIGARASKVDLSFHAHEFGDEFYGVDYPKRPTMTPALDRQVPSFLESFHNSIGN